jgi:hypothetical protein
MSKCPNCKKPLGNCVGTSSLYGSHDIGDLCEDCWLEEEDLIDEEGTNSPEYSEKIKARLAHYRSR